MNLTNYLCELPFVTVAAIAMVLGGLGFVSVWVKRSHSEDDMKTAGCGLMVCLAGLVALAAWAVLRFVVA
jgi:hypothetical protein